MSDRVTIFDEPKRYLDEEDLRDAMDDLWKYMDGLKKTIVELEEVNWETDLLLDIKNRQLRDLKAEINILREAARI